MDTLLGHDVGVAVAPETSCSNSNAGSRSRSAYSGTHKRPRSGQNVNLPLSWMMRRPQLLLFFPKAGLFIWAKLTGTVVL
jgi:hypothetical protein